MGLPDKLEALTVWVCALHPPTGAGAAPAAAAVVKLPNRVSLAATDYGAYQGFCGALRPLVEAGVQVLGAAVGQHSLVLCTEVGWYACVCVCFCAYV
jgi:hypothetical protein